MFRCITSHRIRAIPFYQTSATRATHTITAKPQFADEKWSRCVGTRTPRRYREPVAAPISRQRPGVRLPSGALEPFLKPRRLVISKRSRKGVPELGISRSAMTVLAALFRFEFQVMLLYSLKFTFVSHPRIQFESAQPQGHRSLRPFLNQFPFPGFSELLRRSTWYREFMGCSPMQVVPTTQDSLNLFIDQRLRIIVVLVSGPGQDIARGLRHRRLKGRFKSGVILQPIPHFMLRLGSGPPVSPSISVVLHNPTVLHLIFFYPLAGNPIQPFELRRKTLGHYCVGITKLT